MNPSDLEKFLATNLTSIAVSSGGANLIVKNQPGHTHSFPVIADPNQLPGTVTILSGPAVQAANILFWDDNTRPQLTEEQIESVNAKFNELWDNS